MDREEVRRVAELARLELSDAAADRMARELSAVLDFVATLQQLDLSASEPVVFAPAHAPLRDDAPDGRTLDSDAALAAAPARDHDFFLVPPIVENLNP